jgi:hypothetical protein
VSKTNTWENELLLLAFNNTNSSLHGDATGLRGSSSAGSYYFSLHTADPGEAGDQTTSEAAYTSYARVAVARSGSGFTVTGNAVALAADVTFPEGHWRQRHGDSLGPRLFVVGLRQAALQGRDQPEHRLRQRRDPGAHGRHCGDGGLMSTNIPFAR